MPVSYVSLGGNVGDVTNVMRESLDRLDETPGIRLISTSRNFRTAAVGSHVGGDFVNSAAALSVTIDAVAVLAALHQVESALGRTRGERWGTRPIDLDLIFYGDEVIAEPALQVPHPNCWYRRFVLDPLMDIATDVPHPELGVTVHQLRERLLRRPLPITVEAAPAQVHSFLISKVNERFRDAITFVERSEAAVILSCDAEAGGNWRVELKRLPGEPAVAAVDVLTAALDEPVPIA